MNDAKAIITQTLFRYVERPTTPRLWGIEHAEARAQAVLDALSNAGFRIIPPPTEADMERLRQRAANITTPQERT